VNEGFDIHIAFQDVDDFSYIDTSRSEEFLAERSSQVVKVRRHSILLQEPSCESDAVAVNARTPQAKNHVIGFDGTPHQDLV
jgi:hypothetical protein